MSVSTSTPPDPKPRMLITGASGYLGSAFLHRVAGEFEVVALGRTHPVREGGDAEWKVGAEATHPRKNVDFVPCDLAVDAVPPDALEGVSVVVHLAGKAHALEERPGTEEESYRAVAVGGTRKLLEAARRAGVRRFVLASTVKVYPGNPSEVLDETAPVAPETPYGRSKEEAEKLVLEGGFVPEPVVLRFSMIHGGRETGNVEKMAEAAAAADSRRFPSSETAGPWSILTTRSRPSFWRPGTKKPPAKSSTSPMVI